MATYDPQKVSLSVAGNTITGYAAGTFIKATRNEDGWMLTIGADGGGARTRNANKSGRVEITLLASSPSNDVLQAQAIVDELEATGVGPLLVKDGSGTAVASAGNSWIVKHPDLERGKELGEITWIIETEALAIQNGGTTQIP